MLKGKRAVITGGGRGFGQALCVWLAREGVEIDFSARRAEVLRKPAASLPRRAVSQEGISAI